MNKIAKKLLSEHQFELRMRTLKDISNDTPITKLKIVFKGTLSEINKYAKSKNYEWIRIKGQLFGGYWHDKNKDVEYIIT